MNGVELDDGLGDLFLEEREDEKADKGAVVLRVKAPPRVETITSVEKCQL